MKLALFIKFPRVLLAFIVSVWMAGGCLFGCSNMQVFAAETVESEDTVVEGDSCEPAAAHSCCTKPKTTREPARTVTTDTTAKDSPATRSGTLSTAPRGMADCPLIVYRNAVTVKSSDNIPEPGLTPVAVLPGIASQFEPVPVSIASSFRPNRGPTHLRCCVFLI